MWPNPQETTDLVIFIQEIFNEKINFLRSVVFAYLLRKLLIFQLSFGSSLFEIYEFDLSQTKQMVPN